VRYRSRAVFGLILALAGVIGLWGIGFFSVRLAVVCHEIALCGSGERNSLDGKDADGYVVWERSLWSGITSLLQNGGAFLGIFMFSYASILAGRRRLSPCSSCCRAMTAIVFLYSTRFADLLDDPAHGLLPACSFGGYAIYFPECSDAACASRAQASVYNVGA